MVNDFCSFWNIVRDGAAIGINRSTHCGVGLAKSPNSKSFDPEANLYLSPRNPIFHVPSSLQPANCYEISKFRYLRVKLRPLTGIHHQPSSVYEMGDSRIEQIHFCFQ